MDHSEVQAPTVWCPDQGGVPPVGPPLYGIGARTLRGTAGAVCTGDYRPGLRRERVGAVAYWQCAAVGRPGYRPIGKSLWFQSRGSPEGRRLPNVLGKNYAIAEGNLVLAGVSQRRSSGRLKVIPNLARIDSTTTPKPLDVEILSN